MHGRDTAPKVYGTLAEFDSPEALLSAAQAARDQGYRHMDAYSPIPVHGLTDILDFKDGRLHWLVLGAGITGAAAGLGLQVYTSVIDYPWNVGGKPMLSLPSFVPVTFEATVLFAAGAATVLLFALNGLPKPHHPVFNGAHFSRASQDRFFLCVEASDPSFESGKVEQFLWELQPISVETISTSEGY